MTSLTAPPLPDHVSELLRKIRRTHQVAFEPFRVRDIELQLLQATDLEGVLKGRDPFADVSDFPFWVKLWEAAIALADVVAGLPDLAGRMVLELGAGLAAPGLVAAARGAKVTLSDYEPIILDFQRVSAAANGLTGIEYKILDWREPPTLVRFDLILGAEILFREDLFAPLLSVFDAMLAPGGEILLAHDLRHRSLKPFMEMAMGAGYEVKGRKLTVTAGDEKREILVNRLRRMDSAGGVTAR